LIRFGVEFDRENGRFSLGREGAHGRNRILHAGGDATGSRIEVALCRALRSTDAEILEHHFLTDLLVESGRVVGVAALDSAGERRVFSARHVVLASGGSGQLFRYTTNPEVATGDGLAAAYRAGAALADLEFYQFHPTALALAGAPTFLISEAVRGEGGILRDAAGRAFMKDYDPRGELASRDIVSRAIDRELERGSVYLDVTHLPADLVRARFPTIVAFLAERGLDVARDPIPVAPAAHYQMGGILTTSWGETTLPGLLACGEVAASGVHGANRLASNSLLEGIVFASRVVRRTLGEGEPERPSDLLPPLVLEGSLPLAVTAPAKPGRDELRRLMWEKVGLTRTADGLTDARERLDGWVAALGSGDRRESRELANLALIGRLMAEAALRREESRGAHYRADFRATDPRWRRRIVIQVVGQVGSPLEEGVTAGRALADRAPTLAEAI
jgi:L-aspartate oxidase